MKSASDLLARTPRSDLQQWILIFAGTFKDQRIFQIELEDVPN
jgi:hypothetical protein